MNTSTLHHSSYGRILLLTRLFFFETHRRFLITQLWAAGFVFVLPFTLILVNHDFDLQTTLHIFAGNYAAGQLFLYYFITCMLGLLGSLHQITHDQLPSAYTQIPASTGEKLLSIVSCLFIYFLGTMLTALVLTQLCSLSDRQNDFLSIYVFLQGNLLFDIIEAFIGAIPLLFTPVLIGALCMIHFRKALVGFMILSGILIVGCICYGYIIGQYTAHFDYSQPHHEIALKQAFERFLWIARISHTILDLALIGLIYYRLRTLQIK